MIIHHIITLPSGDSKIELRKVPMSAAERPMSATYGATALFFRETSEGHVQGFHNAPRRQLIFITSGLVEIETSDGKRWSCRPGDILFTEDFDGRGHITRSLRETRGFFHVIVPEDFVVTDWPLVG